MRRVAAMLLSAALLAAATACGGGEGVEEGAAVSVYVAAGLCAGAERQLAAEGGGAGAVTVLARCLAPEREAGELDLAAVGANARRASEDSTAVGYLLLVDPAANRFATPILDSAGIGSVESANGEAAMRETLGAIADADPSDSIRDQVRDALEAE